MMGRFDEGKKTLIKLYLPQHGLYRDLFWSRPHFTLTYNILLCGLIITIPTHYKETRTILCLIALWSIKRETRRIWGLCFFRLYILKQMFSNFLQNIFLMNHLCFSYNHQYRVYTKIHKTLWNYLKKAQQAPCPLLLFKRMDEKGRNLNHFPDYSAVFKLKYKLLSSVNTFFSKAIKPNVSSM